MGNVKLIGMTHCNIQIPVEGKPDTFHLMSAESFIAYCARVSNPTNQDNPDSEKLLKYLVKNKHWSPFEMVHVVMEINTTRDIARQILRHRSFSFQEFSQRYAEVQEMSEPREARLQDQKNRQNSIETDDEQLTKDWNQIQSNMLDMANGAYNWAIKNGIAKEVARSVLPEGLTMSRMYMSGSLRSWLHYIQIRTEKGTQKEHRQIAEECKKIILKQFPSLNGCFEDAS